jgi:hypothetical protein
MTKHTSSKEKIEEAIRLLDKLQDDREGFPTDWTGIRRRITHCKKIWCKN